MSTARAATALLTLGALGLLGACSVADTAPVSKPAPSTTTTVPDPAATRAESTYLAECLIDNRVKRPTSFVLTCGDGGELLRNIVWHGWGQQRATATATFVTNSCQPTCASGKDLTYSADVVADQLVESSTVWRYRRLTVTSYASTNHQHALQEVYHLP